MTFYDYITTQDTTNIKLFICTFNNTLHLLPNRVCSSKILWNILHTNTHTDTHIRIFHNCFMEYFLWKINTNYEIPIR